MVKLYKSSSFFKEEEILIDNESFFNNFVTAQFIKDKALDIMQSIDKADFIDVQIGTIRTPYGNTDISSLSTGCKTIINYIYVMNNLNRFKMIKAINATECGWNALDYLFEQADKYENSISIIVEHDNGLFNCEERDYLIDGERQIASLYEF